MVPPRRRADRLLSSATVPSGDLGVAMECFRDAYRAPHAYEWKKTAACFVTAFLLVCATSRTAGAVPLTPSDVLRFEFSTNPENFGSFTPDVLGAIIFSTIVGPQGFDVTLLDGWTVLGTYSYPACCPPYFFKSSGSPYVSGNPTVIDFSSILDGTIEGTLEFRPRTSFEINGDFVPGNLSGPELVLAEATGPESAGFNPNWVTVSSIEVVPVPEPASFI